MAKNNGKTAKQFNESALSKLFIEYDKLAEARAKAEQVVEESSRALSSCVARIYELTGEKSFKRKNGDRLLMMIRPSDKELQALREAGKPVPERTYFFRSESSEAITTSV